MNSTSYVFSFVLGLIVVIVFLVVLNSRFNFVSNLFRSTTGNSIAVISPTPEPSGTPSPTKTVQTQTKPTNRPTLRPTAAPTKKPENGGRILGRVNPTTNPRPTTKPHPTVAVQAKGGQVRGVAQIPNTGFPTAVLAVLPATLYAGFRLRKTS